jgi:hypothetical protein
MERITASEAESVLVAYSSEHAKDTTDQSGGGMRKKGQASFT